MQLHLVTTGVPVGQKELVVLEKVRQPPCSHLEFCASLQGNVTQHSLAASRLGIRVGKLVQIEEVVSSDRVLYAKEIHCPIH